MAEINLATLNMQQLEMLRKQLEDVGLETATGFARHTVGGALSGASEGLSGARRPRAPCV